jgi:ABC-2 type transport system ATP-binding protein
MTAPSDPPDARAAGTPTGSPPAAISAVGLVKDYRGRRGGPPRRALDAIDLDVPRGSFFGLLGPNGAGKSTFLNILAGIATKTAGAVSVWGYDIDREPRAARAAIGIVPQELHIDAYFTPYETLEYQAGFYGVPPAARRTDEILAALGLTGQRDAYARRLSGGMRRRLLVAKALVHAPPVLVLDEPTAGVDVELRHQLWAYVRELNRRGTTVVLTTHYLEEAEQLCDRIAIIDRGRVVACDTKDALVRRLDEKTLVITLDRDIGAVPPRLARIGAVAGDFRQLNVRYRRSETAVAAILAAVAAEGLGIADLSTRESRLEDLFLQLTRRTAADDAGDGDAAAPV